MESLIESLSEGDRTSQQLVRYEALFKLLGEIQPLEDIDAISALVARQWKYFANVVCWHLVIPQDRSFLIIDASRGEAQSLDLPEAKAWDLELFRSRIPRAFKREEFLARDGVPENFLNPSITELYALPIMRQETCIGVVTAGARKVPFDDMDEKFIKVFGTWLTDRLYDILLRKKHLDDLLKRATNDALTNMLNRGTIIERLEILLDLSGRTELPVTVILADIDHFKNINDTWGHLAGDRVLREVSARLKQNTRQADHIGRFGGEEFLAVLHPCDECQVAIAAERFRRCIADSAFLVDPESGTSISVTISMGTATAQGNVRSELILKEADDALYAAKRNGRNQAISAPAVLRGIP